MNSKPSSPVRWGIIGPGSIARSFAAGVAQSSHGRLAAIAARDPNKPGLAEAFPGARILSGYEAMLSDPGVDAVYISTPPPSRPTPSSTPRARPAPSPARPSCTGCTRRRPGSAN